MVLPLKMAQSGIIILLSKKKKKAYAEVLLYKEIERFAFSAMLPWLAHT